MGTGIGKKHLSTPIRGQSPKTTQLKTSRIRNRKLRHVQSLLHRLSSGRRPPPTLHQIGQIRKRDQKNHLPILRQFENTITSRLRGHHRTLCRRSDLRFGETHNRCVFAN